MSRSPKRSAAHTSTGWKKSPTLSTKAKGPRDDQSPNSYSDPVWRVFAASFAFSALATTKFDGQWSVVVYTTSGPCDTSFRFSGQISNGEISYAYGSIEVTGHIEANGVTYVRVTSAQGHGEAHGRMTETRGSGTWSGRGDNGVCAGTWFATRPN
jgi:hypothetical protein